MGYTSGATMEDRSLRDVERWKDKIEVRLDNRQVFFLFFGSALVACLLFILGVMVGKRLESRGRAIAPEIEDPLALLDKVAAVPAREGVTFHKTLFNPKGQVPAESKRSAARTEVKTTAARPSADTATASQAGARSQPDRAAAETESPDSAKVAMSGAPGSAAETIPRKPAAPSQAAAGEQARPPGPTAALAVPAPAAKATPGAKPAGAVAARPPGQPEEVRTEPKKARFTLQLSSFQDRGEAEAFAARFQSERAYMVASEIPGKGTWYRVRVGDFASYQDAMTAKAAFEKKHSTIALVAQR